MFNQFITKYFYVVCIALAFAVVSLSLRSDISTWTASFWVIDYSYGFVKRGFVAEILPFLAPNQATDLNFITQLVQWNVIFYAAALAIYCAFLLKNTPWLAVGVLLAGFSLQQFSYDLGRFDQLNHLLMLINIAILIGCRKAIALAASILISVIMLLIHEASAFLTLPVIFAVMALMYLQRKFFIQGLIAYAITVVSALFLIQSFGDIEPLTYDEWFALHANRISSFELNKEALVSYDFSLKEHANQTFERLTSDKTFSRILRLLITSLITIFIAYRLFSEACSNNRIKAWVLLIPVVGVLPMFLLGIDFYRWLAAMQFNFFIVAAYYLWSENKKIEIAGPLIVLWHALSIYTGPFGVSVAMPLRLNLVENLLSLF